MDLEKNNQPSNQSNPSHSPSDYPEFEEFRKQVNQTEQAETLNALPSPEEKTKSLTFENLSNLTTEEYLELWRMLNPFFVTHVTRQGVRDHNGMIYHSAGLGELHHGFTNVLEDDKTMRTPAAVHYNLPPNFNEDDVRAALEKCGAFSEDYKDYTPEQVLQTLPFNMTMASADPWADKQAIHFAQHAVLDDYYGGETDNEIFFVYPTDVIASQCQFGGHLHAPGDGALTTAQIKTELKWNDLFVWPQSGTIPVDAGFVFLPADTPVDPNTGSQYATEQITDASGNQILVPVKDTGRIQRFSQWLEGLSDDSPEIIEATQNHNYNPIKEQMFDLGIPYSKIGQLTDFGEAEVLLSFIQRKISGNFYETERPSPETPVSEVIEKFASNLLAKANADLKFAEHTVDSKTYWRNYFAAHPEQTPAHLVFYSGKPSDAVRDFLKENQILEPTYTTADFEPSMTGPGDTSERDGDALGFDDHYIGSGADDPKMAAEHARFNEIALKLITEQKATN